MSREYTLDDYTIEVTKLEEKDGGGYVAYIPEIGWATCSGSGDDKHSAVKQLEEVFEEVARYFEENGMQLPKPNINFLRTKDPAEPLVIKRKDKAGGEEKLSFNEDKIGRIWADYLYSNMDGSEVSASSFELKVGDIQKICFWLIKVSKKGSGRI